LALAGSLPLTEGEKFYIASLKKLCEFLENLKEDLDLFTPLACVLIIVIMVFLSSLIMDVAVELKGLGDLKKHTELMNSLQEVFSAMSNAKT